MPKIVLDAPDTSSNNNLVAALKNFKNWCFKRVLIGLFSYWPPFLFIKDNDGYFQFYIFLWIIIYPLVYITIIRTLANDYETYPFPIIEKPQAIPINLKLIASLLLYALAGTIFGFLFITLPLGFVSISLAEYIYSTDIQNTPYYVFPLAFGLQHSLLILVYGLADYHYHKRVIIAYFNNLVNKEPKEVVK